MTPIVEQIHVYLVQARENPYLYNPSCSACEEPFTRCYASYACAKSWAQRHIDTCHAGDAAIVAALNGGAS